MLDNEPTGGASAPETTTEQVGEAAEAAAPKRRSRRATRAAGSPEAVETAQTQPARARRARKKAEPAAEREPIDAQAAGQPTDDGSPAAESTRSAPTVAFQPPSLIFQEPVPTEAELAAGKRRTAKSTAPADGPTAEADVVSAEAEETSTDDGETRPRRRRRGGRGRRQDGSDTGETPAVERPVEDEPAAGSKEADAETDTDGDEEMETEPGGASRRRRRRRRRGGAAEVIEESAPDDPERTVVKVREPRSGAEAEAVKGSTRLEAKKQRRRESRESGRRRAPVISEAEFLARRESVERVMVVREVDSRIQIAVLEDGILVEHYVSRETQSSYVGNVYLGRVQNVLPSMEAAFVDIGRGRNAVLYAGEVNFDVAGLEGQPKRIENVLKSGQSVLAQVTKDPIAHKGARLTSQISLPGRFLVYVPEGSMTGISRKLPEAERNRLKSVLRSIIPDDAGFIVRTASEGASEDELQRDVKRLIAQWENIQKKAGTANAPALLYGEPDLTIRVIRDIFNEDFTRLVVSGEDAWDTVEPYVSHVAPDLVSRVSRWTEDEDVFAAHRIDEQLVKALDRKVWLPSGGSVVIDRTEAMTVVDVNTGKFTGQGGNLEETVTKNNLEAAEEVVRQLRLRDIGGIIVVDFIDMVLESNRELVSRRLLECLGRDRTKHQVAEVTSLGLVQMTRKRVGQGLLEAFSESCDCCNGRGIKIYTEMLEARPDAGRRRPRGSAQRGTTDEEAQVVEAGDSSPNGARPEKSAPAPSRRRRRATRQQGSPAPVEVEPELDGAATRALPEPNGAGDGQPSGTGAVPVAEPGPSHADAQPASLGWPG